MRGGLRNLFINPQTESGSVIKLAPQAERRLACIGNPFLFGACGRSALAGCVSFIRMKGGMLSTDATSVEIKKNIEASFGRP